MTSYSARWFSTFLGSIDPTIVAPEIAFLERVLPRERVHRVLDLCCGPGRHTGPLAALGYDVLGLDINEDVLRRARALLRDAAFVRADMNVLPLRPGAFDAAICMWQSFGYGDDATNLSTLRALANALRPHGRLVLDLYNRDHFEQHTGSRTFDRGDMRIFEQRAMHGRRLRVELRYASSAGAQHMEQDVFDWRLYSPGELQTMAAAAGLRLLLACTRFDEGQPSTAAEPRMQAVLLKEH